MDKQIKEINEEIKKAIQRIKNIWKKYDELREKYKAKEQECEELKEALNEGCLHNLTLMTEQRVLLQTLAEIKEIAEEYEELHGFLDCSGDLILQKISECEVER